MKVKIATAEVTKVEGKMIEFKMSAYSRTTLSSSPRLRISSE